MTGLAIEQQLIVIDFEHRERIARYQIKQSLLDSSASGLPEARAKRSWVGLIASYVKPHRSPGQSEQVQACS